MKRNYKNEYNHSRREALEMAERYGTSSGIGLYLSFTKYGKTHSTRLIKNSILRNMAIPNGLMRSARIFRKLTRYWKIYTISHI